MPAFNMRWNRILLVNAAVLITILFVISFTTEWISPNKVSSAWESTVNWGASHLPNGKGSQDEKTSSGSTSSGGNGGHGGASGSEVTNGSDQSGEQTSSIPTTPPTELTKLVAALFAPLKLPVTAEKWTDSDGAVYKLPPNPIWTKPLGKRLCIIDIDTRPLNGANEILSTGPFNWTKTGVTSAGMMGHYLYAQIHGYDYKFVRTPEFKDRDSYWTKISALSDTLRDYEFVISIDADAQFQHPEIPFEWLLNRWKVNRETALTLTIDPDKPFNLDPKGRRYNNCGFVVGHNIPRTHEILQSWASCPDEPTDWFKGCAERKKGWPAEQAAFGDYIRYMYNQTNDLNEIPCDEANGFPESDSDCSGRFVRHLWTAKELTKDVIANGVLQGLFKQLHDQFLADDLVVVERKSNDFVRAGSAST